MVGKGDGGEGENGDKVRLVRHKEDRGRRKRNHIGICIMPNEALERLMGCLLASIAKKKKKERATFSISASIKQT